MSNYNWTKINMANIIIRVGVAYSFCIVPYSLATIKRMNRRVIAMHWIIRGLPKSMSNVVTQLPHDMFGIEIFSQNNVYIICIGEQLINALNDKGRFMRLYKGLIQHVLASHEGAQYLTPWLYTNHQTFKLPTYLKLPWVPTLVGRRLFSHTTRTVN